MLKDVVFQPLSFGMPHGLCTFLSIFLNCHEKQRTFVSSDQRLSQNVRVTVLGRPVWLIALAEVGNFSSLSWFFAICFRNVSQAHVQQADSVTRLCPPVTSIWALEHLSVPGHWRHPLHTRISCNLRVRDRIRWGWCLIVSVTCILQNLQTQLCPKHSTHPSFLVPSAASSEHGISLICLVYTLSGVRMGQEKPFSHQSKY
jgi:hypothetical protein